MFLYVLVLDPTEIHLKEGYGHVNSNGQFPSICTSNKGWVIQVYHRETVLNLRLRYKVGFLRSNEITWGNQYVEFDRGFYPRIAINDSGMVVVVFASQVGPIIYCRLGKLQGADDLSVTSLTSGGIIINDNTQIDWYGDKVAIARGYYPAVSINNDNTVVIVYQKQLHSHTKYRIGDITQRKIEWRNEEDRRLIQDGTSKHATVAINDKNQVAIGYSSSLERAVHFMAGKISELGDTSVLLLQAGDKFTPPGVNYQPAVDLNNHGHVVASFHSLQGRLSLKYNCGMLHSNPSSIKWAMDNSSAFAYDGYYTSVAVTDSKKVIVSYKSLTLNLQSSIRNRFGEIL